MENLTLEKRQLCDIQGRLFELALKAGADCPFFIESFMNSKTAAALDDVYCGLKKAGTIYLAEVMYWTGYIYRYWHYYTNEYSREIYKIADAKTMNECWLGFHTFDVEMAIDDLKEIYGQNRKE